MRQKEVARSAAGTSHLSVIAQELPQLNTNLDDSSDNIRRARLFEVNGANCASLPAWSYAVAKHDSRWYLWAAFLVMCVSAALTRRGNDSLKERDYRTCDWKAHSIIFVTDAILCFYSEICDSLIRRSQSEQNMMTDILLLFACFVYPNMHFEHDYLAPWVIFLHVPTLCANPRIIHWRIGIISSHR